MDVCCRLDLVSCCFEFAPPYFGFRVCASDLFIRLPKALLEEWNRGQLLL